MYDQLTNKELMTQEISARISENIGINNTSKSTVVRHITDAITDTAVNLVAYSNAAINSTHTQYASGDLLTKNAYEFGVVRNIYSDVYISKDDAIVNLVMSDGSKFPKYMDGKIIIEAGKVFLFGSGTSIEVTENVYVSHNETSIPIPVRITTSDSTDIKTGTKIDISDDSNPVTIGTSISIDSSVYTNLSEESDDSLRRRTVYSKMRVHGSSDYSIRGILSGIPTVRSSKIVRKPNDSKTYIYITTDNYLKSFIDENYSFIKSKIVSEMDYLSSSEQSFDVLMPEVLLLDVYFKYKNTTSSMAMSAINESFNSIYTPLITGNINFEDLVKEVNTYGLDVTIEHIIIRSDIYGTIADISSGDFAVPDTAICALSQATSIGLEESE